MIYNKDILKFEIESIEPTGVIDERDSMSITVYNSESKKQLRYLLTIGQNRYWVDHKGEILNKI